MSLLYWSDFWGSLHDLKVLAKNGDKVYEDKYEMIIRRTSKYPNQIWQTDHSLLDLLIIDCDNQKKKPWLTVVIDDFSRAIAGFSLFYRKSIFVANWLSITSSNMV